MITHPLINTKTGSIFAFEIENIYVSQTLIVRVLSDIDGVSNIELRRLFSSKIDVHINFFYLGIPCMVWEPFGDSSRYWIGPQEDVQDSIDFSKVEEAFRTYKLGAFRAVLGDFLSLNFLLRWFKRV